MQPVAMNMLQIAKTKTLLHGDLRGPIEALEARHLNLLDGLPGNSIETGPVV